MAVYRGIFLRMKNFSDKPCGENQITRVILHIFFFENRAVSEMIWKNNAETNRL
jgi:hypothetical protein